MSQHFNLPVNCHNRLETEKYLVFPWANVFEHAQESFALFFAAEICFRFDPKRQSSTTQSMSLSVGKKWASVTPQLVAAFVGCQNELVLSAVSVLWTTTIPVGIVEIVDFGYKSLSIFHKPVDDFSSIDAKKSLKKYAVAWWIPKSDPKAEQTLLVPWQMISLPNSAGKSTCSWKRNPTRFTNSKGRFSS